MSSKTQSQLSPTLENWTAKFWSGNDALIDEIISCKNQTCITNRQCGQIWLVPVKVNRNTVAGAENKYSYQPWISCPVFKLQFFFKSAIYEKSYPILYVYWFFRPDYRDSLKLSLSRGKNGNALNIGRTLKISGHDLILLSGNTASGEHALRLWSHPTLVEYKVWAM